MIDERFIILSLLISFAGALQYIVKTLKGETKPNRVTWFLWTLIPLIAFFAMLQKEVSITPLITTFLSGFIPLLIFAASFLNKKAFWRITKFDYICGALSLVGVAGWIIVKDGNIAIWFAIFADILAGSPTIIKAYKYPKTESWFNYFGGGLNALVTLLTIKNWTFASVAWVMDIFIMCAILFVFIKFEIGERIESFSVKA